MKLKILFGYDCPVKLWMDRKLKFCKRLITQYRSFVIALDGKRSDP